MPVFDFKIEKELLKTKKARSEEQALSRDERITPLRCVYFVLEPWASGWKYGWGEECGNSRFFG